MKKQILRISIALFILACELIAEQTVFQSNLNVKAETIQGKVTASILNIRSGPSTHFRVVGSLEKGNVVNIIASSSGWYKITSGSKMGFVSSQYISKVFSTTNAVNKMKSLGNSKQLLLVTASNETNRNATIETFEKIGTTWKKLHTYTGFLGKNGLSSNKHEGDYESPEGKYTITSAFGRLSNPGTRLHYKKTTANDVWVDDPNSTFYNTLQSRLYNNGRWNSAESMNNPLYDYGFVINYNTSLIPGKGSAIFFHVSGKYGYTAGCTATSKANVVSILKWLDPSKQPIIIQSPINKLTYY